MDEPTYSPPPLFVREMRPQAPPPSHSLRTLLTLLILLLAVWVLPGVVERVMFAYTRGRERAEVEVAREALDGKTPESFVQISEQVAKSSGPSVVHIDVDTVQGYGSAQEQMLQQWLNGGRQRHEINQGSGVIMDADGYVLTNNHVVEGANAVQVNLSDGRRVTAEVLGTDPLTDLAVLKIDAEGLIPAPWGDSDSLPVGAPVWAVGNPYGLDRSVTLGIVSAKSRGITNPGGSHGNGGGAYQEFLQTDAAVNPGNSGGPLVNASGQVVGITSAIVGSAYQGISFAIPSKTAHDVYDKLRKNQKIVRGYLGVALQDLTPALARHLGLKDTSGVIVAEVVPGSPADKGGFEKGDVIVAWHGQAVENKAMLQYLIARTEAGSTVECVIVHDGQEETKSVRVVEAPQPKARPQTSPKR